MDNLITAKVLPDLKLEGQGESAFRKLLASNVGHTVVIAVKRYRKPRTNQQLKTVMGLYMDIMLEQLGYEATDKDWLYGILKMEMGWTETRVNKKTGEKFTVPGKTAHLDTEEYSRKFMDAFVRNAALQHEIVLPDPVAAMAVV